MLCRLGRAVDGGGNVAENRVGIVASGDIVPRGTFSTLRSFLGRELVFCSTWNNCDFFVIQKCSTWNINQRMGKNIM